MIIVDLKNEKNLDSALRTYKSKVHKVKQIQKLRERESFVKPSVKKRNKRLKAIYTEKLKGNLK